jgi:hypothetical protein
MAAASASERRRRSASGRGSHRDARASFLTWAAPKEVHHGQGQLRTRRPSRREVR